MNILQWLVIVFTVFGLFSRNATSAQCGERMVVKSLMRGAVEAKRNYWPWLAALISRDEEGQFFCGGTLISMKSVITAAHCMHDKGLNKKRKNPGDFEVHLGRLDLTDDGEFNDGAKVLEPIIIIAMHPDWDPKNIRYDADLALLIAAKEIENSFTISPICLQNRDIPNVNGTTVGWGFSSDTKRKTEDRARQAEAEKVSLEDCLKESRNFARIVSRRTLCVKGTAEGSGPCTGDSGSGFFTKLGDIWFIDGIVSAGSVAPESQCPSTRRSLFTKISSFTKWIERGINKFYEVQFTYILNDRFGYLLTVPETLRRGAFLSSIGHSVDLKVKTIKCADQDWEYLPNNIGYMFPMLEELHAFRLKIKSIQRLNFKNMERLEKLDLSNNLIEEIPSNCFDDLKKLVRIKILDNKLKRIHANTFIHNPSLETIDLKGNQIQPNEMKNLRNTNVEELWLESNQLESVPFDAFDGLPNLKKIFFNGNNLTTLHKDTFSKNLKLIELSANENQIQNLPEGLFRNNANVEMLRLQRNQLESIPFDAFHGMTNLMTIYLDENNLTTFHKDTFSKNLKLTELWANDNQIQNLPEGLFRNNANVEILRLDQNQLESVPFDAFHGMTNLKAIDLHENNLTTFHKDTFSKNLELTKLHAYKNQIQTLPEGLFRNNEKLRELVLWDNKITEINTTFQTYGKYDFEDNICISKNFAPSDSTKLIAVNEELQRQCSKK